MSINSKLDAESITQYIERRLSFKTFSLNDLMRALNVDSRNRSYKSQLRAILQSYPDMRVARVGRENMYHIAKPFTRETFKKYAIDCYAEYGRAHYKPMSLYKLQAYISENSGESNLRIGAIMDTHDIWSYCCYYADDTMFYLENFLDESPLVLQYENHD